MKRTIARLTLLLAVCAAPLSAQGIGLAVGTMIPQSDLAKGAKTGLVAMPSLELGGSFAFRIEVLWANSDLKGLLIKSANGVPLPDDADASGDVKLIGGLVSGVLHFSDAAIRPYILGGAGFYNRSVAQDADDAAGDLQHLTDDDRQFGWHAGFGVKFKLGPVKLFGEARFHSVDTEETRTKFVPILVGIRL